ncbi:thiazole tautomerase TenI [Jeotgalibacillus sp. S-D1]|uniref:thiamine phosphate synthase n=1 Tax=Jeotgalibacillus sp. S-D1 TaxID=2552189 RepID=UPI00105AA574|nr:thiamine phosphate synthase [Jeotgalibacillus sp. S-D1]TDL30879.1 thiazole tautomerase TenI [Jeotgalibacillus sp. S-D1]
MGSFQYHLLSTCGQTDSNWVETASAVHKVVDNFHIREKTAAARDLLLYVDELLHRGVPASKLVINDRIDVALARGLAVQLAYHSLPIQDVKKTWPDIRTGVSVHSVDEAREAADGGADYVFFGHVFQTGSKPGLEPKGISALEQVVNHCPIPVIAIGGIKPHHVPLIQQAGAAGVAVLSGVMGAADPQAAIQAYKEEELT